MLGIPERLTKGDVAEYLMHDYIYEPLEHDFMEMVRTGKDIWTEDWLIDDMDDSCNMTSSTAEPARVSDITGAELYIEGRSLAVVANTVIGGGEVRVKTVICKTNCLNDLITELAVKFIEKVQKSSKGG